ncbi:hypothetical protein K450DRAFT_302181 [Umbelopsis ramanniana AG]|uniref:Uncharacterized protein n=1 Tax=Umbelopsis ramanniana AG TaxID=1314678 RepID=A0AAD5E4L4_UMBRA|nr:uncharacterized protein K450DRAFT_302181 [Umbelopsis ramanniana AG]KAI8577073.1 hypothetical protein K450DRAFT_302181 [Umbelopsis ramanniana AG]
MPIPHDIVYLVCSFAIGDDYSQYLSIMQVNHEWAEIACRMLYCNPRLQNYVAFCGFVRTVTKANGILPYAEYVRALDTAAVNKYDLRRRLIKLIACCHGLISLSLGYQPASVELDFFAQVKQHCPRLQTLQLPDIEKCIFMQEWNFSGFKRLRTVHLIAAPIGPSSITSLPKRVKVVRLERVAFDNLYLERLLKTHPYIQEIEITNCKDISKFPGLAYASSLQSLTISGRTIDDSTLKDIWSLRHTFIKCDFRDTCITDETLIAISNSSVTMNELYLNDCSGITIEGARALLLATPPPELIDITGCMQISPVQAEYLENKSPSGTKIIARKKMSFFVNNIFD